MSVNRFDIERDWGIVRHVFRRAQNAGLYHTFSSINDDGTPNITPIGSLVLSEDRPGGFYFDVFNRALANNVDRNSNIAILAVDSRKHFWFKSILFRKFNTPPAIRLIGKVSARRQATPLEVKHCIDEVKFLRLMGESSQLGKQLKNIREVTFTRADVLNIGAMTNHAWRL